MPTEYARLFNSLARSKFRSRFRLNEKDFSYLTTKGLDVIMDHARGFLTTRLFPDHPANDGKQTPMRGHPVFVAQHATATCCRECLAKWHGITAEHPLTDTEQAHVLGAIRLWLERQMGGGQDTPAGSITAQATQIPSSQNTGVSL